MAKPYSQTGHGPLGGTEDESSLAHGEASRGDAEGDGGTEADWDIPAAPDNSPLSRILGVVLVVVLAGVFSFVAYRKYDEARRNPTANQTVADNASPSDPNADAGATSPAGERNAAGQSNASQTDASKAAASFAQNRPASADGFGSLDDQGPSRSANGAPNSLQRDRQAPGAAAFAQARTTANTNPAAAREADANPFGDLGNSPERPNQQPPTQGEPPQQLAAGTPNTGAATAGLPIKADANGGFPGADSPNHTIVAGGVPHGAGEHRPVPVTAADADMQNLFPNEGAPQHDRPTPNPQNLPGRGTPLEPAGMNRTAQLQDPTAQVRPGQIAVAQTQPGQVQPSRTPPTQNEPLDNETLDGSHSPAHSALGERGVAQMQPDSRGPKSDAAMSAIPSAGTAKTGRAEALLAGKEREPNGDDSPFGNSPLPATSSRGVPQPTDRSHSTFSPVQTSSTTNIPGAGARSPSASDDPFGGDRSATNGRFAEKSGPSPSAEGGLSQPGRLSSGAGSVTAVGTTNDAGDYYVVQPQDNFWSISRKKYGTSRYFHALAELNKERIPDAGRMRPGMKVSTPPAEILEERYSQLLPPGTKVQVAAGDDAFAKVTPTGFLVSPDGTPKYRTGEHDTLSEIAAKHLGRSSRWIQIYEMNRDKLSNPNQLKVGTELVLPGDASSVGMSNEEDDRR
jgi:nucleoid-associated protein YgaU